MNIGYDAKRLFHNGTGLGQYSRTLVQLLSTTYPDNDYFLFNPKFSDRYSLTGHNIHEIRPSGFFSRMLPSVWRSKWVTRDLRPLKINLYHGLSHEIALGLPQTGIPSVVTIHDLIHERYPQQYSPIDVKIYRRKFRYACKQADKIIAISEQTKQDIIDFYQVERSKIEVCYQCCLPIFSIPASPEDKQRVIRQYQLPERFFLSVGSIIERKNLLNICKALFLARDTLKIPLVVIGTGGKYLQQVKDFIRQYNLENQVIFLSEQAGVTKHGLPQADLATIYQLAVALIYPSLFEGFGIPVLEGLTSGVPVITSNLSCLPEVGGDAAYYVNPLSSAEIAEAMKRIAADAQLAAAMVARGIIQTALFSPQRYAAATMDIYQTLC